MQVTDCAIPEYLHKVLKMAISIRMKSSVFSNITRQFRKLLMFQLNTHPTLWPTEKQIVLQHSQEAQTF